MANKHAVVRTDLMDGTDVRAQLVSVRYMGADGNTPTEIENGNVLKVDSLIEGERELYCGVVPAANDDINSIVLIASVENMYDERKKNLDEFINEAGADCRGYRLHHGNIYSVTAEALTGTPAKGSKVTLAAGTKLEVGGSGTAVGKIIDVETAGRYTYYAIRID